MGADGSADVQGGEANKKANTRQGKATNNEITIILNIKMELKHGKHSLMHK